METFAVCPIKALASTSLRSNDNLSKIYTFANQSHQHLKNSTLWFYRYNYPPPKKHIAIFWRPPSLGSQVLVGMAIKQAQKTVAHIKPYISYGRTHMVATGGASKALNQGPNIGLEFCVMLDSCTMRIHFKHEIGYSLLFAIWYTVQVIYLNEYRKLVASGDYPFGRIPDGATRRDILRGFWTHLFEQFREFFILDFNIVNWKNVLQLTLENANPERSLQKINSSNDTIDNAETPLETLKTSIPFDINTITLKDEIKTLTTEARTREGDDTKRYYLYYGILDFFTKKDDKKTKTLLKTNYDKWREDIISSCTDTIRYAPSNMSFSPNNAYDYAKNSIVAKVLKIQKQQFKYPSQMNEYTFVLCCLTSCFPRV
ncbi:uncharacterized protein EV154DRAFT_478079 [Mucor mucedo]|uniref:uncharacterized protein n=1 Tax=Mucor mucedo TaxID=29922 RepID=UPI0022207486|nr:uncharacterized protein EV154DRAFT_478079 [Mucor mucedo]KAI7894690.1 hypothetical protein EV154DRAFT_478079 [Mucor mucedo]